MIKKISKISKRVLVAIAACTPFVVMSADVPAIEITQAETPNVKVHQGGITVEVPGEAQCHVEIYALTGQKIKELNVAPGTTTIDLRPGLYVVRIDHRSLTITVR